MRDRRSGPQMIWDDEHLIPLGLDDFGAQKLAMMVDRISYYF